MSGSRLMPTPYTKPALTIAEQIDLLRTRGMVLDQPAAMKALEQLGYYRLSGYWYPFRKFDAAGVRLDEFRLGTTLDAVISQYEFDRALRLELLNAIERIEVALRTAVTYHFAHHAGPQGYADPAHFRTGFAHADWLSRADDEVSRSREKFIEHFAAKYEGFPRVPIWMLTEVVSIGSLSKLLTGLATPIQSGIARQYKVHQVVLTSWVHALTVVRNHCAHHARLWNREFGVKPKRPERDLRWAALDNGRLFAVLLVLRHMLRAHAD
ncbi:MAG: Abi family protein, partial [Deltaproteobacteria bacterium]